MNHHLLLVYTLSMFMWHVSVIQVVRVDPMSYYQRDTSGGGKFSDVILPICSFLLPPVRSLSRLRCRLSGCVYCVARVSIELSKSSSQATEGCLRSLERVAGCIRGSRPFSKWNGLLLPKYSSRPVTESLPSSSITAPLRTSSPQSQSI